MPGVGTCCQVAAEPGDDGSEESSELEETGRDQGLRGHVIQGNPLLQLMRAPVTNTLPIKKWTRVDFSNGPPYILYLCDFLLRNVVSTYDGYFNRLKTRSS